MRSLSAHLRRPEDHAQLPFHPDCPICRGERLAGVLPAAGIVSRRSQATIAAGVLAFSTGAPPLAMAGEPDQTTVGTTAPQPTAGDPAASSDFDPGGDSTDLPFDAPPTPQVQAPPAPDSDDAAPLEPEPATDTDAPVADAGDNATPPGPAQQPGSSIAEPEPAVPTAPDAPTAADGSPAPATPAPPTGDGGPSPSDAQGKPRRRDRQTAPKVDAREQPRQVAAAPAVPSDAPTTTPVVESPAATVEPVQPPRSTVRVITGARTGRAVPGDRFHVVLRGESLWSIATDVLGDRASVARVAREVNRLWALNQDRIATGDRDLLMIGTRLRLR